MFNIKSRWDNLTAREKWHARTVAFGTKVKATKAVWFPPEPGKTSTAASKAARRTAKKTSGTAKKRIGKKTAKKAASSA